jgi:hypothetical protein
LIAPLFLFGLIYTIIQQIYYKIKDTLYFSGECLVSTYRNVGLNLYPYIRLGPHEGGKGYYLTSCITCWQWSAAEFPAQVDVVVWHWD